MFDVIVGPSSVGKSVFYEALRNGRFSNHEPGPMVLAHALQRRIPRDAVLHYNMLRPHRYLSQRTVEAGGWEFRADPVFRRLIRERRRIRHLWVLVSGREELLGRMTRREKIESAARSSYDSEYWLRLTHSLDLFRLYEQLFELLEETAIHCEVFYSSSELSDLFAPSDRVYCHHNLRGQWVPLPARESIKAIRSMKGTEYQTVLLPGGVRTERRGFRHLGGPRSSTFRRVLAMSCEDRSFLDIGCANGELLFKAERLGASRLVGIEMKPERFDAARAIAGLLQSRVEMINGNFLVVENIEPVDYVLALNVLHHVEDVYGFLRKASRLTRRGLYIEFPTMGDRLFRRYRRPVPGWLLNGLPLMGAISRAKAQTFVFSPKALVGILMKKIGGFKSWRILDSTIAGRRILALRK